MVIALDGPSGSGKSTIAKILAAKLKATYLDTGATFRAIALKVINNNIDEFNEAAVSEILESTLIDIKYENAKQQVYLDGENVSKAIREHKISAVASKVSSYKKVREWLLGMWRQIGERGDTVMDGRDIGTVVFPSSNHKFFLTASSEIRAMRRQKELAQKGEAIPLEKIKEDIEKRDLADSTREFAPLKKADDAIKIDSSKLSIKGVVKAILSKIKKKKKWLAHDKKWENKKRSKWRIFWGRFLFRFTRPIANFFFNMVFPVKFINKRRLLKKQGHIIAANHLSWVDILHLFYQLPGRRSMVAKKELRDNSGFLRGVEHLAEIIFIDRDKPSIASVKKIMNTIKEGRGVCIFPEGTRNTKNRELQPLKSGATVFAIKSKCPILPVLIHHKAKKFRKNYIYIGEPIYLFDFYDKRLDPETLAKADSVLREAMLKEMKNLDDFVAKRCKKTAPKTLS